MQIISNILPWVQIILSIVLVITIMLQRSGSELGGAFGGGDGSATYNTKRGLEKYLFRISIIVAILFAISALVNIFL